MPDELDVDLRRAAKAAAAAAAVGAAAGVARAIATRAESAGQRDDGDHGHDEPEAAVDEEEVDGGPETEDEPEPEPEHEPQHEPEPEHEPVQGASVSEIRRLTTHARELLHELSGFEIETVSAVDRLTEGWRISLEAVELRRIPDSTDVMATYEVDLDGDGDLVRYERRRRYARSQSDREER